MRVRARVYTGPKDPRGPPREARAGAASAVRHRHDHRHRGQTSETQELFDADKRPGEYPCCQIDRLRGSQGKRRGLPRHEGRRVKAAKAVDARNAAGLAVSSRFAAPPLRSGPSGDTASPAAQRSMTTGRVLPVVTDRLFDDGHPTVFEDRLTRRNPEGGFDSPRASNPSECTLFRPSGCPENQDHLEPWVGTLFRGGCLDAGAMPRCRP